MIQTYRFIYFYLLVTLYIDKFIYFHITYWDQLNFNYSDSLKNHVRFILPNFKCLKKQELMVQN